MLQDWAMARWRSTVPWPPSFQSLNVHAPRWKSPPPCMRPRLLDQPHGSSHGIDLDALAPVAAAKEFVEQPLEPALAYHVTAPEAPLLELLLVRLPHVAEQMGGEAAVGIGALRLHFHDHAGQLELPL